MKLVIQRVTKARVTTKDKVVGEIGLGVFVLLGIGIQDTEKDADTFAEKLFKLRVMEDDQGKMNLTVGDVKGAFLVVSQFTLYADTSGGNRPSFITAARPEKAQPLYEYFIERLRSLGATVETGSFGNEMQIDAELDGPVTILIES